MIYKIKAFDLIVLINHLLTSNISLPIWIIGKLRTDLKSINLNKEYIINFKKDNEVKIIDFYIGENEFTSYHQSPIEWKGFGFARIVNI